MFAIQIYFDFSGYSDMAVGLGLMFGIRLRENFNYPYIAKSASDFWRRWNISLGGFFRDYVYIPLGGNRKWYVRNLFVVWFLTGFWHGASWNFIIWGLYFGLLIYLERLFLDDVFKRIPAFFAHVYMTLAMLIGWVFFYYVDFSQLGTAFEVMFGFSSAPLYDLQLLSYFQNHFFLLLIAFIGSTPLLKNIAERAVERFKGRADWLLISAENLLFLLLFGLSLIQLVGSTYNPFLYFRF
jgi:alginate O-acetyltransferase complex protein AlgI